MPNARSLIFYAVAGARAFTSAVIAPGGTYGPKLDEHNEPRFLEQVKLFYNDAAKLTGIDEQYLELINACQTVVRFNIPLRRDNGELETITCYR